MDLWAGALHQADLSGRTPIDEEEMRNAVGGLVVENRDETFFVLEGNADIADVVFGLLL